MSFNLYFAGWGSKDADDYLRERRAHRLLSWVNETKVINWWKDFGLADRLFIDSGAFSVAHSCAKVNINDYVDFINNNPGILRWAELDVIPYPVLNQKTARYSSEKSWENYLYMKDRVKTETTILPLYHFGESKLGLQRILESGAEYIGIGGRHGVSTSEQAQYFNEVFSIIQNSSNPNVKVHAFGITVPKLLENFPFYSADSTTWLQVAINGMILARDFSTLLISDGTTSDKANLQNIDRKHLTMLFDDIEFFGYNFDELCRNYLYRLRYNIDVMLDWEKNYMYKGPSNFKSKKLF